jgi:hypothetical protein
MRQPAANEKAETNAPLPIKPAVRSDEEREPLAGLTRIALSVFW